MTGDLAVMHDFRLENFCFLPDTLVILDLDVSFISHDFQAVLRLGLIRSSHLERV